MIPVVLPFQIFPFSPLLLFGTPKKPTPCPTLSSPHTPRACRSRVLRTPNTSPFCQPEDLARLLRRGYPFGADPGILDPCEGLYYKPLELGSIYSHLVHDRNIEKRNKQGFVQLLIDQWHFRGFAMCLPLQHHKNRWITITLSPVKVILKTLSSQPWFSRYVTSNKSQNKHMAVFPPKLEAPPNLTMYSPKKLTLAMGKSTIDEDVCLSVLMGIFQAVILVFKGVFPSLNPKFKPITVDPSPSRLSHTATDPGTCGGTTPP